MIQTQLDQLWAAGSAFPNECLFSAEQTGSFAEREFVVPHWFSSCQRFPSAENKTVKKNRQNKRQQKPPTELAGVKKKKTD